MNKGSFEAKLHGFRRTQDGVIISYVVNPHDVSTEMATAALGTRYMIGFAEIGDNENEATDSSSQLERRPRNPEVAGATPAGAPLAIKRKFSDLPLVQQAALRCNDDTFQSFLNADSEERAAEIVREYCNVKSRSEIIEGTQAGDLWLEMEQHYQDRVTTARYGEMAR